MASRGRRRIPVKLAALVILALAAVGTGIVLFLPDSDPTPTPMAGPPRPPRKLPTLPGNQPAAPAPTATNEGATPSPPPAPEEASPRPVAQPPSQPAPTPAARAPAPATPLPPTPVAAPTPLRATPPVTKPAPPPEEDLPTMLARLRREKTAPSIAQPATVIRNAAPRDIASSDGETGIRVTVAEPVAQNESFAAFDLLLRGRYDEALSVYEKLLSTQPRNLTLLLGHAATLQKLARNTDARDEYRKVLAIDPNNREALTNMTALVGTQAPEQALAELRTLARTYPGFSPIEAQIGALEAARGDGTAAIEALSHAVALSPENGLYRLNLAIVQDREGMVSDAAATYRAALDLIGPNATGLPLPLDQVRRRLTFLEGR